LALSSGFHVVVSGYRRTDGIVHSWNIRHHGTSSYRLGPSHSSRRHASDFRISQPPRPFCVSLNSAQHHHDAHPTLLS
jgi:hypothetical protein